MEGFNLKSLPLRVGVLTGQNIFDTEFEFYLFNVFMCNHSHELWVWFRDNVT
jgi:hypothetical protein